MFTAKVANYFGMGNERTVYPDGGWAWNVLVCKLGRYKVRIIQKRDIISNKIKAEGLVYTSDFEIIGVRNFVEGKNVTFDICCLLSLASLSQVVPFHYEFKEKGIRHNVIAEAKFFRPLLTIKCGETIQKYLELTWPHYRKLKRKRKLAEVIEMINIAELNSQPLEVRLALVFIILENLKGTYAKMKGYPFIRGFYVDPTNNKLRLNFKVLLTEMLSEQGMSPALIRIITLRNEIIHFGLSRKPYESLRKNYEACQDIVQEYLLRLLGYKGHFQIYSTKGSGEI
jgi:hypothetical protein